MVTYEREISDTASRLVQGSGGEPFDLAVIFGSGLGVSEGLLEPFQALPYTELSLFPGTSVPGHEGRLILSRFKGHRVVQFCGRHHFYEGLSAWQVTCNVRLARSLGCRRLLITNAAGGINPALGPGDILFVRDHLNLLGDNPLRGQPQSFVDLSELYERSFFPPLSKFAGDKEIRLMEGVLAAVPGPSYETPAEVNMLRILGADAVSMSSVPEAIMAKYLGMEVATLSFIANAGAGCGKAPLSHEDVLEQACRSRQRFSTIVEHLMALWLGALA